ncbi:holo-ACP synthase [Allobranchiibius sp. GilTou73]|uniref:holo-ACP synthase n=1 Tax=Allobranchiibius sp. GilTou73 TaxID=2904523 RepID=UPI001F3331BC|nr:holo-ACP synthase [Allobranchiibius sp. GilTou73]UIJ34809.1 holo-ACP synthase [Allobranchiibius sp. GilTou73]
MIVGVGVDVVEIARFARAVESTPALLTRLFAPSERDLPMHSLAGRFAAKEALAKAFGAPGWLRWLDAVVIVDDAGAPSWVLTGTLQQRADELGVRATHLSISHDGGLATAMVVAEK